MQSILMLKNERSLHHWCAMKDLYIYVTNVLSPIMDIFDEC